MRLLVSFLFVFSLVVSPLVHAEENDEEETHACASLKPGTAGDKFFEAIFGNFERALTKCCENTVKSDCDSAAIATVCKMNVNQGSGSCPEQCRIWAQACKNADLGARQLQKIFNGNENSRYNF